MRYNKLTKMMTAAMVAAMVLCGCETASEPEKPMDKGPEQTADAQKSSSYVEQVFPILIQKDEIMKGYSVSDEEVVLDSKGNYVQIVGLSNKKEPLKYHYAKIQLEDGKWVKKEAPWLETINQEHKDYDIRDYWYGSNGELYVSIEQKNMNLAEWEKYWYDKKQKKKPDIYTMRMHLWKVNEETNEVTEIPVPKEAVRSQKDLNKEMIERGMATKKELDGPDKGIVACGIRTFPDGNLLIRNYGRLDGEMEIYSGATGEKLADLSGVVGLNSSFADVCIGNDFLAFVIENEEGEFEIRVIGENGKLRNIISTGIEYYEMAKDYPEGVSYNICAEGDLIQFVINGGIYEAQVDGDSFEKVVDAEKNDLPYLKMKMDMNNKYRVEKVFKVSGKDSEAGYAIEYLFDESEEHEDRDRILCCYTVK